MVVRSKHVKKFSRKFKGKKKFNKRKHKKKFGKKRKYAKRIHRKRRRNPKNSPTCEDYKLEEGGVAQSPPGSTVGQDIFLGYATDSNITQKVFVLALLKKLMAKYGIFYPSDDYVFYGETSDFSTIKVQIGWRIDESSKDLQLTTYTVPANTSFRNAGLNLYNNLQTDVQNYYSPASNQWPRLKYIRLVDETTPGPPVVAKILALLEIDRCVVKFSYSATMKFQNKTQTEGASSNTDVLGLNPLQCRLYKGKGYRNYISIKNNHVTDGTNYKGWVPKTDDPNGIHGVIFDNDVRHTLTTFRALPDRKTVDAHSTKDFVLHPAQIVKDSVGFKSTIGVDKFMQRTFGSMTTSSFEGMEFGIAHVIGFDKLLYDRSAIVSSVNTQVTVGYQLSQRYVCDISLKKMRNEPYVQIFNQSTNWSV